jgi:predicted PurR-regulated permease PerM
LPSRRSGDNGSMWETARRTLVASLVVLALLVGALALWKLRLLLALLFLAFVIASAMRPAVEALCRRRVPRAGAILLHYAVLAAGITLLLWAVVPRVRTQLENALPTTESELASAARHSTGVKHDVLRWLQTHVDQLPSAGDFVRPSLETGVATFEILVGIFFVFAAAAYWIYERDRALGLTMRLVPEQHRLTVRDTWDLIDLKLGAYVRGQGLLVVLVAAVLSTAFWAIGLPFWLLLGIFAGIVEVVPVLGPLIAGALAVSVGLTIDVEHGIAAGVVVLAVRLLEDYLVIPRVLGEAVGLSPLLVLVSVAATGLLFGGFAVPLAIPLAAVVATLFDVIVLDKEPADEEVPTVLFPAKDAETAG